MDNAIMEGNIHFYEPDGGATSHIAAGYAAQRKRIEAERKKVGKGLANLFATLDLLGNGLNEAASIASSSKPDAADGNNEDGNVSIIIKNDTDHIFVPVGHDSGHQFNRFWNIAGPKETTEAILCGEPDKEFTLNFLMTHSLSHKSLHVVLNMEFPNKESNDELIKDDILIRNVEVESYIKSSNPSDGSGRLKTGLFVVASDSPEAYASFGIAFTQQNYALTITLVPVDGEAYL